MRVIRLSPSMKRGLLLGGYCLLVCASWLGLYLFMETFLGVLKEWAIVVESTRGYWYGGFLRFAPTFLFFWNNFLAIFITVYSGTRIKALEIVIKIGKWSVTL